MAGVAPHRFIAELVATWLTEPAQHLRRQRRRSLLMDYAEAPRGIRARVRHSGIAAHPTAIAVQVRRTAAQAAIQLSVHSRLILPRQHYEVLHVHLLLPLPPLLPPRLKVSKNARCSYAHGATGGFSCLGSKFGDCSSQYSYWYEFSAK